MPEWSLRWKVTRIPNARIQYSESLPESLVSVSSLPYKKNSLYPDTLIQVPEGDRLRPLIVHVCLTTLRMLPQTRNLERATRRAITVDLGFAIDCTILLITRGIG